MAKKNGKRYSAEFKFQLVLEALERGRRRGGRAGVRSAPGNPLEVEKEFLEKGTEVFGGSEEVAEYEKRVGDLERTMGQKEVEIALLKNFLNGR